MKVKSKSEVIQSCPTLGDPMDCRLPDSSVHGIFQATVLEWVAIAFFEATDYPCVIYMIPEERQRWKENFPIKFSAAVTFLNWEKNHT